MSVARTISITRVLNSRNSSRDKFCRMLLSSSLSSLKNKINHLYLEILPQIMKFNIMCCHGKISLQTPKHMDRLKFKLVILLNPKPVLSRAKIIQLNILNIFLVKYLASTNYRHFFVKLRFTQKTSFYRKILHFLNQLK